MKNLIPYSEFIVESHNEEAINEGIFDMLKNMWNKLMNLFKDPIILNKQIDSAATRLGTKVENVPSKGVALGTTIMAKLQSPDNEAIKMVMSFTKLADMPDGSGLYQITGTDSPTFLKSIGLRDNQSLNTIGVMAILDATGFIKGKPLTMRMYKNISKDGRPIVTETVIQNAISADEISREVSTSKPTTAPTVSTGVPAI